MTIYIVRLIKMGAKNKPYPESNKPRAVSLGGQYKKRKGSEFFSASVTARGKKGSELKVGYDTVQTKIKRPFVSERHREKRLHASGTLPIGGGVKLRGSVDRFSDKGSYQVDAPNFQGSGIFGNKPMYTYGAGIDVPIPYGTGSLDASYTPGQESIGRKDQKYIMGRLSIPFNKGGKVKKRSKRKKK